MDVEDRFNPKIDNDIDHDIDDLLSHDTGYNVIYKTVALFPGGRIKKRSIKVYSSSGVRTQIRNASSGIYYKDLVGSANEDKYFKVAFATGVLTSKNNSSTLFYNSPEEYIQHMKTELDEKIIEKWRLKQSCLY
jgi:hypothetical protein